MDFVGTSYIANKLWNTAFIRCAQKQIHLITIQWTFNKLTIHEKLAPIDLNDFTVFAFEFFLPLTTLFIEHVDDVRAQVQRAVKDLSIEQSLKTYDEVWLSKIFELRPHTRIRTEIDVTPTNPVS